jgi:hypothetical protein
MNGSTSDLLNDLRKIDERAKKFFGLEKGIHPSETAIQAVILVATFMFLHNYMFNMGTKAIHVACWPFFQSCRALQDIVLFNYIPDYRGMFLAFLMLALTFSGLALFKRYYGISFLLSFVVYLLTLFPLLISTDGYNALVHHQDQYLFYACLIFYLAREKRVQLLIFFYALTYLYSSIPKFTSEYWILGLIPLPYFNELLAAPASNVVTFLQIILPTFILFGNRYFRYASVILLESFHFYSMTISNVGFSFYWVTIPFIYLLFAEYFERIELETFRKNIVATFVLLVFTGLSFVRLVIPGSDMYTTEGSGYALNMFNTYHTRLDISGDIDPNVNREEHYYIYPILQRVRGICKDGKAHRLSITFGSIYNKALIVDEPDLCKLEYKPFWRNAWIHDPPIAYSENLNLLNETQKLFKYYYNEVQMFYFYVFTVNCLFILYKLFEKKD